jgi:hypothetical protein
VAPPAAQIVNNNNRFGALDDEVDGKGPARPVPPPAKQVPTVEAAAPVAHRRNIQNEDQETSSDDDDDEENKDDELEEKVDSQEIESLIRERQVADDRKPLALLGFQVAIVSSFYFLAPVLTSPINNDLLMVV